MAKLPLGGVGMVEVIGWDPGRRARAVIRQASETETVWVLASERNTLACTVGGDGKTQVAIWPAEPYAAREAIGHWEGYIPVGFDLTDIRDEFIEEDLVELCLFPTETGGVDMSANDFLNEIRLFREDGFEEEEESDDEEEFDEQVELVTKRIRPEVSWGIRDPAIAWSILAALPPSAPVFLDYYEEDETLYLRREKLEPLFRAAIRYGHDWFQVIDPASEWRFDISPREGGAWSMWLAGRLAEWRPQGDEATLESINVRGKGAAGRIPPGLPALAYAAESTDPGMVRGIRRQPPEGRLAYFRSYTEDEIWVSATGVAPRAGFLGSDERPLGGEEARRWAEEAPDEPVDVMPGDVGANPLPRRQVVDLIWERIKET